MGVTYKLKPEIREYIFQVKKTDPNLSCRKLTALISNKFQLNLSKSTVNFLLKTTGLSMPVGRRHKPRRRKTQMQGLGIIFLQAADYLLGGTASFVEAIKRCLPQPTNELLAKIEYFLYAPILPVPGLLPFGGQRFNAQDLSNYFKQLDQDKTLLAELSAVISGIPEPVRYIKVILSEGGNFYLDGQWRTVWSSPAIPVNFSTPLYHSKARLNRCLEDNAPLVLFMAPGYDAVSKAFFDFILSLISANPQISRLILGGKNLEDAEVMPLEKSRPHFFAFGLWPWQFSDYRKINTTREFRPFSFAALKKDFYLAAVEVELAQPEINKTLTLKGCALKTEPGDKVRLFILGNLPPDKSPEALANLYLSCWPNLEETLKDYSQKIERFSRGASPEEFLASDNLAFNPQKQGLSITNLFAFYLKILDAYVKSYFLPAGYAKEDFSLLRERFYQLSGTLKTEKDYILLTLRPPEGYAFLADLNYACCRLNEQGIRARDDKALWCGLS